MRVLSIVVFGACTASNPQPVGVDPSEGSGGDDGGGGGGAGDTGGTITRLPDVRCDGTPDISAGDFRHVSSSVISALGDPRHRGVDLIAAASAGTQTLAGWASYTIADKALEDEDIDVFGCRDSAWEQLGSARTDDEGRWTLDLADTARLPLGMRDMFMSVVGDRTGTKFLAYVAPDDAPLIVSDIDGTLTASENAFIESIALGGEPDAQPGAGVAFTAAATKLYQLVYVTARGSQYTGVTRDWLDGHGFPRGPLRLSPSFVTLPGGDTIDYKTTAIGDIIAANLSVVWGIGNRASDITAYANVGLAGDHTFVKLPEYQSEVQAAIDAGQAVGFASYDELETAFISTLP